jgi:uncharacterized protein
LKKFSAAVLLVMASLVALTITSYRYRMPFDLEAILGLTENLYSAKSLVTGQRDETRIPGFERAVVDVVKKLSGDHAIASENVLAAVDGHIRDYVKDYGERDRMEDAPIHDEQGTRDRPFELTVVFHRNKIDELLRSLGRAPWTDPRPQTLVLLTINTDAGSYVLTSDEDRGIDQRASILAAAWQAGIPITLPTNASLTDVSSAPVDSEKIKKTNGADVVVIGNTTWNSSMKGWQAEWQLTNKGVAHQWKIRDVNFDDAFRNAMRGEAQILSGHGEPPDGLK